MTATPSLFFRFLCHPMRVGALCPSSPILGCAITSGIGIEEAGIVVELGPGTGAITRCILNRLPEDSRFIGVELDRSLCDSLQRRYPGREFHHGSATDLSAILGEREAERADIIISGLPWAIFPEQLQRQILASVAESLSPEGCFTTFAYIQGVWLPAGRKFRRLLREYFDEVETTSIVWRNLPPAFSYRCRKPRNR